MKIPKVKQSYLQKNRYCRPKQDKRIKDGYVIYENAKKLADDIDIKKMDRFFCVISGNFVFGDFLEAFIAGKNFEIKLLTISTLSLSEQNIDTLRYLLKENYVEQLHLIVSDYFFAHEKHALIKKLYEYLDIDNRFQLSVVGSHMKIVTFETKRGGKVIIDGSANLRSSANLEQFRIEENESLYDFIEEINQKIKKEYATINKAIRVRKLYHLITDNEENKSIKKF